jgi:hypothetical protein
MFFKLKNFLFFALRNLNASLNPIWTLEGFLLLIYIRSNVNKNRIMAAEKNLKKIIVIIEISSKSPYTMTGIKDHKVFAKIMSKTFLFSIHLTFII